MSEVIFRFGVSVLLDIPFPQGVDTAVLSSRDVIAERVVPKPDVVLIPAELGSRALAEEGAIVKLVVSGIEPLAEVCVKRLVASTGKLVCKIVVSVLLVILSPIDVDIEATEETREEITVGANV